MSEAPQFVDGLSEAEAQARLKAEGYNELPQSNRRTAFRIVLEVLREPMLALLLGSGAIYLVLGDLKDALILLAFALMAVAITVIQETRTERVLEALRDLTSPRALVIRDGTRKRVAGREVVRGDIVELVEGDRVPADAVLVRSHDVQTDESLLTGESVPVRKIARRDDVVSNERRPGGDDLPYVFAGSLIVRGSAIGEVIAIGAHSEIGKIGQSLSSMETESPRLQVQTRRIVRMFGAVGAVVSVLAVLLYGALRGGWFDALLAGIALGMSMLPQEFPIVLTVFMAMGAWRISAARVLTRRAAAIETLGSATVLCTDKTGTLTENRMSIAELRLKDGAVFRPSESVGGTMPEDFHCLVEFGLLASARNPVDPMEKAFDDLGRKHLTETEHLHGPDWELVQAYGLRPGLLAMSHVWRAADNRAEFVIAAKGAPEAIVDLCHLDADQVAPLTVAVEAMATEGLRVLGVARATFEGSVWPGSQHDFAFEFLGLVGLADPLRPGVSEAISECRSAGIKVVMITGDYPATARAIGLQAGLDADDLVTGEELGKLTDAQLMQRARTANVFARIMPEQKLRIVNALKSDGEVVAMTGDGVNDAPSLKSAHIGIAMGATRHRRSARSVVDGAPGRRLRFDRQIGPAGSAHLRQPAQGNGVHLRGACADRRPRAAAAAVRLADRAGADPHRISGNDHRSGVFARVRGRDRGRRRDATTTPVPRSTVVHPISDRLERCAGDTGFCADCHDLRHGIAPGHARSRSACPDILLFGPHDRQPDLRQSLLQCVVGDCTVASEPRFGMGADERVDDSVSNVAVAARKRTVRLRSIAPGRSRADAHRRRRSAGFARTPKAVLAPATIVVMRLA